jgi:L,D-transpeptidase catalytic domain
MIRATVASALVLTAAFATALIPVRCLGQTATPPAPAPPLPAKATKELPPALLSLIKQKKMPKFSPVLMRIFKEEAELEVWKQDTTGRFQLLKIYPICRWSGDIGPKEREGDRQTPEGFYTITPELMNPNSSYYLAINTGFPNAFDKANGRDGSFLMIHGDCSSSGCYAMTDEQVGEIYWLARDSFTGGRTSFQIQAYPFRLTPANLARHRNLHRDRVRRHRPRRHRFRWRPATGCILYCEPDVRSRQPICKYPTQIERRALGRRVIALDPMVDQTLGETSRMRYHASILYTAVHGLFRALDGWRAVATRLSRLRGNIGRQPAEAILHIIPPELGSADNPSSKVRWMADPIALRRVCGEAVRRLIALPASTPSGRLLADETAKVLAGLCQALDGLALLVDAPGQAAIRARGFRPTVPDWMPAVVSR